LKWLTDGEKSDVPGGFFEPGQLAHGVALDVTDDALGVAAGVLAPVARLIVKAACELGSKCHPFIWSAPNAVLVAVFAGFRSGDADAMDEM
jgi:hypothetical protein